MNKKEKAELLIELNGNCFSGIVTGLMCEEDTLNECPCSAYCDVTLYTSETDAECVKIAKNYLEKTK